jgi:hypothetical protein
MAKIDSAAKKTDRAAFWQEHLSAWSASGLTQADYCRQHELSAAAFGWWKRQLQGKPKARRRSSGTKRPPPASPPNSSAIRGSATWPRHKHGG